uniref:Gonadal protein gdl n=1 Tax=Strigamia maritima TaxID=126957 RepID=T1J1H0_STRMM
MSALFGGDELASKELLQEKHYYLFNELQNMARELPPKYQQRLPYELLSALANSLLDGTVYEIAKGLVDIQQMTEKNMCTQRIQFISAQKREMEELIKKYKELVVTSTNSNNINIIQQRLDKEKQALEKRHAEDLTRSDMKRILELDQTVSDQQVTLEKAGVPGFFVTNNPNEIRLQMYLLEFMQKLLVSH